MAATGLSLVGFACRPSHDGSTVVDGGVSDNLGMRSVLDNLEILEALHLVGQPTPLDHIRRIVVFVVNSISSPKTQWDKSESPPRAGAATAEPAAK